MTNSAPDVLQEEERRSSSNSEGSYQRPEVSLVLGTESLACGRERRAREARNQEIHRAAKRSSREPLEIRPDRRAIQGRSFHPRQEYGLGVGVPLDVAHGATPSGKAKVESADTGAEREGLQSHAVT